MKRILLSFGLVLLLASTGCSTALSQPFQNLKSQPITIYRLQNYEPPQAATPGIPGVAGVPPQVQQWLSGAAALLPPNLLPPGLLPGGTPAPTTDAGRFHNFRILGQMVVTDPKQREEVLDLFGHESNFDTPRQSCPQLYAEFGLQFGSGGAAGYPATPTAGGMPADVLVSLSCNSVQMLNYGWPYPSKTGLASGSEKRFYEIVKKAFGG